MEETKKEASKRFSKLQEARRKLHEKYGKPASSVARTSTSSSRTKTKTNSIKVVGP